ncbi:MAG: tetratricopeptide repeat protein [Coriobacteriia bacterium]|nr:tetratricopeptide repeat protein [Coriobacteriia bacterium]
MDEARLAAGEKEYGAAEWTAAAREFLGAAGGEIRGSGYAFHRAGNALMKLKRIDDACAVYERALADPDYGDHAAVARNLGTARMSLGKPAEAAAAFKHALEESDDDSRYKALQGLGGALYELGQVEEAAEMYRRAAIEFRNPDPGKALNNLGLCQMALDHPEDAVQSYQAAVDLRDYRGRGRAAANLGMAYAALGMHERAVAAFERARTEFGHELSPAVDAAYRASVVACVPAERVDGWSTGEMPAAPEGVAKRAVFVDDEASDDVTGFFARTDEDMRTADREARRKDRSERREAKPLWVTLLVWGAVVVLVAGLLIGAYVMGYGYPTQQMTVNGVLGAYSAGEDVGSYWVAVPASDVEKAMSGLPPVWQSYSVGAVERSARVSTVEVTVVHEQGGEIAYRFSLAREGVGWKINGITTAFNSLEGGI